MKEHLDAALDVMIPGGDGFPSAVSLDLGHALLAGGAQATALAFLAILPDDLAAEPRSTRTALLKALEQREATIFAAFVLAAYRAYYSSPAVVVVIEDLTGHAARPPQPLGYAVPPFDESLLAVPKQRAPHYRRP